MYSTRLIFHSNINLPPVAKCVRHFRHQNLPIITVPKYLEDTEKNQKKAARADFVDLMEKRNRAGDRRIKVIHVPRDTKLNHYLGQTFQKNKLGQPIVPMVSEHWRRGIKHGNEELIFKAYARNRFYLTEYNEENIPDDLSAPKTFEELRLNDDLVKLLSQRNIVKPSNIQREAIPAILTGRNVLCCAETGSGKTLTYLGPVLQMVKRAKEKLAGSNKRINQKGQHMPYALIVAPTRELAEQISNEAIRFANPLSIGVACMIGGAPKAELDHTGYDVIVTTAGLLPRHIGKVYSVGQLHHLVLDEADTLLDDSFYDDMNELVKLISTSIQDGGSHCQFIFVSATMPRDVEKQFRQEMGINDYDTIVTESLHRIPNNIEQRFIRLRQEDRTAELLRIVSKEKELETPTMVFCNMTKASDFVHTFLRSNGIPCLRFNKKLTPFERMQSIESFLRGDIDILACTDIASRGLDTKNVRHIINFDCPRSTADYLHRAGRVGRLSSGPKTPVVTTFVSFRPNIHLVQELEYSLRMGTSIASVDGNVNRLKKKWDMARSSRRLARSKSSDTFDED